MIMVVLILMILFYKDIIDKAKAISAKLLELNLKNKLE